MTHDECKRLLIRVFDEIEQIKWYQHYLDIALEQLNNPSVITADRVELLLSSYLEHVEPCFDNLDYFSSQREELRNNILADS